MIASITGVTAFAGTLTDYLIEESVIVRGLIRPRSLVEFTIVKFRLHDSPYWSVKVIKA